MPSSLLKFLFILAVYVAASSQSECPMEPECSSPCDSGLDYPSMCPICVCPPDCEICTTHCYFALMGNASCHECAPSVYCYGVPD